MFSSFYLFFKTIRSVISIFLGLFFWGISSFNAVCAVVGPEECKYEFTLDLNDYVSSLGELRKDLLKVFPVDLSKELSENLLRGLPPNLLENLSEALPEDLLNALPGDLLNALPEGSSDGLRNILSSFGCARVNLILKNSKKAELFVHLLLDKGNFLYVQGVYRYLENSGSVELISGPPTDLIDSDVLRREWLSYYCLLDELDEIEQILKENEELIKNRNPKRHRFTGCLSKLKIEEKDFFYGFGLLENPPISSKAKRIGLAKIAIILAEGLRFKTLGESIAEGLNSADQECAWCFNERLEEDDYFKVLSQYGTLSDLAAEAVSDETVLGSKSDLGLLLDQAIAKKIHILENGIKRNVRKLKNQIKAKQSQDCNSLKSVKIKQGSYSEEVFKRDSEELITKKKHDYQHQKTLVMSELAILNLASAQKKALKAVKDKHSCSQASLGFRELLARFYELQ